MIIYDVVSFGSTSPLQSACIAGFTCYTERREGYERCSISSGWGGGGAKKDKSKRAYISYNLFSLGRGVVFPI
jgi:hypothetical protein